ncbi:putative cyclin [Rosa chinensis]|uniref:B-like cyclin n=2 Tax=Rosa TaxID=3764 RepID=A0A2P6PTB5_ROSCH|nr:G2/mitotic-specific cyclin-2 isoform X1 [Rosa chinensis]XP_024162196.1 G2/mitotic-specific cyclin-2 isoform X1 [Rosa chinensis]PRQ25167.1 putative cyclin [Rosa chinensis]
MGSKENNQGLVRPANFQGPRLLGGSKFVKEIGHNHRAALSNITNFKREASGNDAAGDKKLSNLGHRPITRRFAAQMVQQCPKESEEVIVTTLVPNPSGVRDCDQEIKKLSSSTVNPSGLVDCEIIDVEDSEDEDSDAVPMYVKHTEAMLDEIDRMEEDEESEDPIMDIDTSCIKDQLSVVEYIDDIYAHYRKTENQSCVSPSYMAQQPDINEKMRAILIDWLIEVHYKFELMDETLFLTINLIDRFLERQVVVRKKLQLVGVTAMLLACKYEEVSVPIVEDFVLISDKAYTRKDVLDMEKSMVNKLQFNFSVPTSYVFMRRFLKAAQSDKKLELLSFFLIELCLVEYEMLKFPPSLLAAAAIYTAQCSLLRFKQWSKTSEWYTNYSEDELQECSRLMVTFHQKAETGRLTGVHRKYSTWKFGNAAKAEPAEFLLNP